MNNQAARRKDPVYRAKQAAWNKDWRKRNGSDPERLARKAEQMRRYVKDPALRPRHEARWQVARAIESGRITRQLCEICGSKAQAHHDDYSKPLDVRWLCRSHHAAEHAKAIQC